MKTLTKYDILVVVLNRLYLLLVIGLHIRYRIQFPIYLARGRKLIILTSYNKFYFSIDPYLLPRERPETGRRVNLPSFSLTGIATYLPREGPETPLLGKNSLGKRKVQLPIYLERGRKPFPRIIHLLNCRFRYRNLSTSRGAGNSFEGARFLLNLFRISPYLPLEGPETQHPLQR